MLSAPALNFQNEEEDDFTWIAPTPRLYRAASVGNSWGVTSIGRGFDWAKRKDDDSDQATDNDLLRQHVENVAPKSFDAKLLPPKRSPGPSRRSTPRPGMHSSSSSCPDPIQSPTTTISSLNKLTLEPLSFITSRTPSPRPLEPLTTNTDADVTSGAGRPQPQRSPTLPRPSRRSSQQRVSLVSGRVLIAPIDSPTPDPVIPYMLRRNDSARSFLSVASSVEPPPLATNEPEGLDLVGSKRIAEFMIEGELGRGAYGLVKRAREKRPDGTLGPPLIIKQVIKSRILADCWKRHPKFGTIPIEIYVMSAISAISYELPPPRPWDLRRLATSPPASPVEPDPTPTAPEQGVLTEWVQGKVVKGHPNICPLDDFFEDNNYYYLVLPSTTPIQIPNEPPQPSDLFDLVEGYPHGLPSATTRTYLGQIADALCFLHMQGIVHRDVKDENVVLGPDHRAILIDFGSSGLVKKSGWDTFSGTLDYAGPEILRGERYQGKPQDVWAYGIVAYVLLVGECPFQTAAEAQEGLDSPFSNAAIALDERCGEDKNDEGLEHDGGGSLGDAAALVRACLKVDVAGRPTFEQILQCRFLSGGSGWGRLNPLVA